MRRSVVLIIAASLALLATSCYQDFDFTADHEADRYYVDADGDWWDAVTATRVLDAEDGDLPVPADWDGDHFWDKAVVRPNGDWVTGSTAGTINYPKPAQLPPYVPDTGSMYHILPVPGDYDGDGSADPAWYRDSDGTWFIEGMASVVFGAGPSGGPFGDYPDQDFPVPADYDGDDITDLATFSPVTMAWSVRSSVDGSVSTVIMEHNEGLPLPVPGDYDKVGHAQRATAGYEGWDVEGHDLVMFGQADGNYPAVADYDGDGHDDFSYVSDSGVWHTSGSATTYQLPDDPSGSVFPIPTSRNLIVNIARLTFVGMCSFDPDYCP